MKKNILSHKLLTLISVIFLLSCFGLDGNNKNHMATILLTNLTCIDCDSEVNNIIQSIEEIEYYELWINNEKTTILLNIEYDYNKTTIEQINLIITSYGYRVELLNNKQ
jgi:copper chaperone CopZ